jgi:hypothetical protein
MRYTVILAAFSLASAGCAQSIVPVSGVVTLDGKPLAGAIVNFQPAPEPAVLEPGVASAGTTDASGRFTLTQIYPEATGARIGRHRVSVTTKDAEGTPERVPAPYNDDSKTTLFFVVPSGGTSEANIDLISSGTPAQK